MGRFRRLIPLFIILFVALWWFVYAKSANENDIVNRASEITLYPNLKKQLEKELAACSHPVIENDEDERNIPTGIELKLSIMLSSLWETDAMREALIARDVHNPEDLVLADLSTRFSNQQDYIVNWETHYDKDIYMGSRALYEDALKFRIFKEALKGYIKDELELENIPVTDELVEEIVKEIKNAYRELAGY